MRFTSPARTHLNQLVEALLQGVAERGVAVQLIRHSGCLNSDGTAFSSATFLRTCQVKQKFLMRSNRLVLVSTRYRDTLEHFCYRAARLQDDWSP